MKKSISILLSILLLSMFTISSFAAVGGNLTVENTECFCGDTINITVNISNNPGIVATKLSVNYDNTKLKLLKVENGKVFKKSNAVFGNSISAIPYTMLWEDALSTVNNTSNGTLATLTFEVIAETDCETTVSLKVDNNSSFDVNLKNVKLNVSNGTVVIKSFKSDNNFWSKIVNFFKKISIFFQNLFK